MSCFGLYRCACVVHLEKFNVSYHVYAKWFNKNLKTSEYAQHGKILGIADSANWSSDTVDKVYCAW